MRHLASYLGKPSQKESVSLGRKPYKFLDFNRFAKELPHSAPFYQKTLSRSSIPRGCGHISNVLELFAFTRFGRWKESVMNALHLPLQKSRLHYFHRSRWKRSNKSVKRQCRKLSGSGVLWRFHKILFLFSSFSSVNWRGSMSRSRKNLKWKILWFLRPLFTTRWTRTRKPKFGVWGTRPVDGLSQRLRYRCTGEKQILERGG